MARFRSDTLPASPTVRLASPIPSHPTTHLEVF